MDVIHEVKTRKSANDITDEVEFEKIKPDLLRHGVFTREEADNIKGLGSDKKIMKKLTSDYLARKGAYDAFRDSLKFDYPNIVRNLDKTVVEKDDITDWQEEQSELETLKDVVARLSTNLDNFALTILQQQEAMLSEIVSKIVDQGRKKTADDANSRQQLKKMVGDATKETASLIKDGIADIRNDLGAISKGKTLPSQAAGGAALQVSFIIYTNITGCPQRTLVVRQNSKLKL